MKGLSPIRCERKEIQRYRSGESLEWDHSLQLPWTRALSCRYWKYFKFYGNHTLNGSGSSNTFKHLLRPEDFRMNSERFSWPRSELFDSGQPGLRHEDGDFWGWARLTYQLTWSAIIKPERGVNYHIMTLQSPCLMSLFQQTADLSFIPSISDKWALLGSVGLLFWAMYQCNNVVI